MTSTICCWNCQTETDIRGVSEIHLKIIKGLNTDYLKREYRKSFSSPTLLGKKCIVTECNNVMCEKCYEPGRSKLLAHSLCRDHLEMIPGEI